MRFVNFLSLNINNRNKLKKKIYNFINENLDLSIFSFLKYDDFKIIYFNNNKRFIYINFVKKKINCLITYLPEKNEQILRNYFINYLYKNPFKLCIFLLNPTYFFKYIKPPKNYLQLFHFVNLNLKFIKRKKKYITINNLHRNVIKGRYKGIFVIYRNSNFIAKKYYFNNNFKIYKKNLFYSLAIKKF